MDAVVIIAAAEADGVRLEATSAQTIAARGDEAALARWRPLVTARRQEVLDQLLRRAAEGAKAEAPVPARGDCAACAHRTRFGNCGRPVEAKLSERFMLIAHPTQGAGCRVFEPRLPAEALALLWRVGDALAAHAIDASDAEAARASIQEHSGDPSYLAEWSMLLDWCMQAQRRAHPH